MNGRDKGSDGEKKATASACLDGFAAHAAAALEHVANREYEQAADRLEVWFESLESAKSSLDDKQQLFSYARHHTVSGYLAEARGLAAYFLDGDCIGAPSLLEKAEEHHKKAAKFLAAVRFPEGTPAEAVTMQRNLVRMAESEALRVGGMGLLVAGDYEYQAANFERAVNLLRSAVASLRQAEERTPVPLPEDDPVTNVLGADDGEVHFVDFARALLHKTCAEQELLGGDLLGAAREEEQRIRALEASRTLHLRAGEALHDAFARRLTRDIYLARQRHDNLVAAARRRSRWAWLPPVVFFVMAIGAATLFVWLSGRYEMLRNRTVFALLLLFVMAVAGVGAQVVNWKDAANWLRSLGLSAPEERAP